MHLRLGSAKDTSDVHRGHNVADNRRRETRRDYGKRESKSSNWYLPAVLHCQPHSEEETPAIHLPFPINTLLSVPGSGSSLRTPEERIHFCLPKS